jgi:hypothetical protein
MTEHETELLNDCLAVMERQRGTGPFTTADADWLAYLSDRCRGKTLSPDQVDQLERIWNAQYA